MVRYQMLVLTLLLFSLTACGGPREAVETPAEIPAFAINFVEADDLTAVLELAADAGKPVFVDVHAVWCYPCKRMDAEVYSDPEVGQHMNEHFVNYRVDAEKGEGVFIADKYQVDVFPTLLFLDQHGHVLVKHEGAAFDGELIRQAEEAMGKYKREAD